VLRISEEGKILIVGSKPSNFKSEWLNNPRLIFWHSTDPKSSNPSNIPKGVEYIIFTRFVDHSLQQRIQALAKGGNAVVFRFAQNTGEIKRLIEESGILKAPIRAKKVTPPQPLIPTVPVAPTLPAETIPGPVSTQESSTLNVPAAVSPFTNLPESQEKGGEAMEARKRKILGRGVLRSFVLQNADFTVTPLVNEARRLWELAKAQGLKTTPRSIEACLYALRKGQKQAEDKKTITEPISKRRRARRDSIKVLDQLAELATLAAVAVRELIEEIARLREENKALKEKLANLRKILK
jgi:hypothetical protein